MGRKYDLVDVMAAIGLVATLFGGYLLVTAADGFWQAPISPTMSSVIAGNEPSTGMQYLQPVLGLAIVQDLLLDRDAGAALSASTMELNRAVGESERMSTTLLSPLVLAKPRVNPPVCGGGAAKLRSAFFLREASHGSAVSQRARCFVWRNLSRGVCLRRRQSTRGRRRA